MELNKILAKNFLVLKAAKNVETKDIAKYLGKSNAMISKYLGGASFPPVPILYEISKYFNISIDILLSEDLSEFSPAALRSLSNKMDLVTDPLLPYSSKIKNRIDELEDKINKLEMRFNSMEQRS